jgi:prolyl-tRNA editing enzyme YbaK/EbsC (Cys-tRNA(Pro) deacylase)
MAGLPRYNGVMPSTSVTEALEALGIPHRLHVHERPLRSLEQAADERGLQPGQIVRSLLFRLEDRSFVLVLAAGPGKVSWPRLRRHLGVTRLTTATAEEVRQATGYEPGAVSPIGLPSPLRILADQALTAHDVVSIGAGIRNAGVVLKCGDLLKVVQPEMGDFLEKQAPSADAPLPS